MDAPYLELMKTNGPACLLVLALAVFQTIGVFRYIVAPLADLNRSLKDHLKICPSDLNHPRRKAHK